MQTHKCKQTQAHINLYAYLFTIHGRRNDASQIADTTPREKRPYYKSNETERKPNCKMYLS